MSLDLQSVMHVNVNCSNLERSLRFYRDLVGLTPQSHTKPQPQDGAGFGLPGQVVWDAYLLHDDRGLAGPALDLLEWQRPKPVGRPHPEANHLGFMRLCLAHEDLEGLRARLSEAGVRTRSGVAEIPVLAGETVRFFCCDDPDGTCIEFIERRAPGPLRMSHVDIGCSDLDRSSAWYQRVLGVSPVAPRAEPPPTPGAGFGLDGACRYRADFLAIGGDPEAFILDLLEWIEPKPIGQPLVEANHLGPFRMAFLVSDAEACCAELDRLGVEHSGTCWLEMGPDLPMITGLNAVFFRDPDGAMLELIETPKLSAA
jgi:catechol 2,3-dioxygenase-like lactoylglutathione lyase family enzyme